jgi:hypothetical protein
MSAEVDLHKFAAERAPRLIAEAEELALAKARERLSEQMYRVLLEAAGDALAGEARAAARRQEEKPAAEGAACYVYGIVGAAAELPEGLEGVAGDSPALLREGELAAIVSAVSLEDFGEDTPRESLEDVEWLERTARAHESVLDAALEEAAAVVPLRLCTVYLDERQVREMLERERPELEDALLCLAGKSEWGAKVIAAPEALGRGATPREIADEWTQAVHEQLAEFAIDAQLNPLQRPAVSGREGDVLLNGVYLVEADQLEQFRAGAAELAERYRPDGLTIELTGPWPAYNFVRGSIEAAR